MQELEFQIPEGSLYYCRQGRAVEITRYNGLAGHVEIPAALPWEPRDLEISGEKAEGHPGHTLGDSGLLTVKSIAKKAFLSKKYLRSVTVPASVEEVGDWAFAHCDALREVHFGGRDVRFGKAVFLECPSLRAIRFPERTQSGAASAAEDVAGKPEGVTGVEEGAAEGLEGAAGAQENVTAAREAPVKRPGTEGISALLAAAVTQMESQYLLDGREAGSGEWLEKWDARMLTILRAADSEGYSKQILCGEEDYESTDLETYLSNSRKKKVRLLLLRLLHPAGLQPDHAEELKEYLLAHTKGCEHEETWQVVCTECGDRREFYELFAKLGCLTKENAPAVIAEIGEGYPEMKAFFLRYQSEHFGADDFFGGLEL